jgi:N6-adenosine-specific RNA methylase IME4/ParB-like chromosome segregation protein Spo0J
MKQFHPIANIFPLIEGEQFDQLVEDIRVNGLQEEIWLHPDDSIIDGRNRYRACLEAEIEPRFRTWDGQGSLIAFVLSLNLRRRHLTGSQKAVLAARLALIPEVREEALRRMLAGKADPTPLMEEGDKGETAEHVATLVGTSKSYVYYALELIRLAKTLELARELLAQIDAGEATITEARRLLQQRDSVTEAKELPAGKYRVLYVDPPWKYGDQLTEDYGPVKYHYPAMTISELCRLPVAGLAAKNAVLFLWTTSPLLEEAFSLIKAWGFEYKASFVWDKVKHNMGHYNSVRHEFLLIAVRGSCLPDVPKLYDSVVSIERGKHSAKPDQFRKMIEHLYPHGKRVELFAREDVPGWKAWGNYIGLSDDPTAQAI